MAFVSLERSRKLVRLKGFYPTRIKQRYTRQGVGSLDQSGKEAKPRKMTREFNNFDWYGQKEDRRFSEINFNQVFDACVAKNNARI